MKNFIQRIIKPSRGIEHKVSLSQKDKIFNVTCTVDLKNISDHGVNGTLIIPCLQQSQRQNLESEIMFSKPAVIHYDEIYGNLYAAIDLEFQSQKEEKILITFHQKNSAKNIKADSNSTSKYLLKNRYIVLDDPKLIKISESFKFKGETADQKAQKIYSYVIEKLQYGKPIEGLYSSTEALKNDCVDCGGFDTLFVSLCRLNSIPARVVSGFWLGYKKNTMHAWAEYLGEDNAWIPVDPSVEWLCMAGRTKKRGGFNDIGTDRIIFSYGSDIPVVVGGKKHRIPILQHPHFFQDKEKNDIRLSFTITTDKDA